jgi:hypothetical protein
MPTSVEDRLAIQDLFIRYAFVLDGGDVEGVVSCFAPGAPSKARSLA